MLSSILRQSNLDLLREINRLSAALSTISVPTELATYQARVSEACSDLRRLVLQNLQYLDLNREDILDDILSQTQSVIAVFRLYNQRIASPLLRYRPSDRLCLRIIGWLHAQHDKTRDIPAGLDDGEFSIWPEPRFPLIYFMPVSGQHGLLYLPLFFHEFGHLLYACHREEMDALVRDLQAEIAMLLESMPQRDGLPARPDAELRNRIVERWYEWAQELFCDAVGLTIGGPCFANAFSMYLRMGGRGRFYMPREQLELCEHPVAWLRIRLIAERARQMNLVEADRLESEWNHIAAIMQIAEDYGGFCESRFLPSIHRAVDNMLTEGAPHRFSDEDVSPHGWNAESSSPVHLLNTAWSIFLSDPDGYADWEEQAIATFLQ